jgi:hypothetical protein
MYKTVAFPLQVPKGKYCYTTEDHMMCAHISFDSGIPSCDLGMIVERDYNSVNVLKDPECEGLEEIKE